MLTEKYITRYLNQRCDKSLELPNDSFQAQVIVVVPAYNEDFEGINLMIDSMVKQSNPNNIKYRLFVLINTHEKSDESIKASSTKLFEKLNNHYKERSYSNCNIHFFYHAFKVKKSGVGHARKILMDLAFRMFLRQNFNGLIVNLDADTIVQENYIEAITTGMESYPNAEAGSIGFEHIIPSYDHPIVDYELHLRYFINMQRLIDLPFAFQTVGSAMVVRAHAYAKEGGMSRKQAGEDFYFLHKYSKNFTLIDIKSTSVMPSARSSDRVPFGTGKAVQDALNGGSRGKMSYNPKSFIELKLWIDQNLKVILKEHVKLGDFNEIEHETVSNVMKAIKFDLKDCKSIFSNLDYKTSLKAFYTHFDAFKLMKYLHQMRDVHSANLDIDTCCRFLFKELDLPFQNDHLANLMTLRQYDKSKDYTVSE